MPCLFQKLNFDGRVFFVDSTYPADVPVEDAFIIVVAHLHYFITKTKCASTPFQGYICVGVQSCLQLFVQAGDAQWPFIHGRKHLDIRHGVQMIVSRNAMLHKIKYKMLGTNGVFLSNKEEVASGFSLQRWHLPCIDAVSIDHNLTLLGLAKEFY